MKSNLRESEEKIEKATELLWKFFWFCFYLLIMPFLISLIAFYLFQLFIMKIYIVLGFTVIIFMFSLLFFYKVFDKYRKKPFFQNNINNLTARINIIFLITISSLIITPIFTFISTEDYSFELLTIISFILLYNIVWFYYYYQPIDLYSSLDGKFKHKIGFKTSISRIHNLVVIINYIIHIIFLFIIFYVGNSWIYLLITNIFFYLIGIVFTKRLRSKIKNAIKEKKDFSLELIKFQRKFVTFIDTLIFCVLIQIPVIILMVPFPGIEYTTLIFSSFVCISIIFIIFYFKTMIYILVHYKSKSKFSSLVSTPKIEENKSEEKITYHWFNSLLSAILIIVIVLFTFLIGMLYLILIILPFIYILSYYELKSGYNTKKSIGWIHLINSIAILAVIAFGILPSISEIFFMNLQLIIFLLSMYFVLEIFLVLKYFTKPVIRLFQNFLAVTSFFLIAYSIYPPMIIEYIIFAFLIVLLISFYRFYPLFFRKRSLKTFKVLIFLNFFAIILYLFFLINIKAFFLLEFNIFLNILVLTILLIPGILLLFLFVNYLINILSVREYLNSTYYTCWILIVTIFLSILMIFYTIIIVIILDLMLISFLIHYQLRFGQKLKKIKETRFKHLNKVNSYFFTVALSCFYFFVFSLWFNIILSIFISLLLISVQISILAKKGVFFSKPLSVKMNIITLLYFSFITFYYILLLTLNTIYVLIVPLISFTIVFYLPLLYLLNKKINPKLIRKALILNTLILSILLLSFPTIIYIELSRLGLFRNITYFIWIFIIMTAINSTLAIFSLILLFTYGILKSQELKKDYGTKILKILIFLIVIFIFSVVFYYPFFYLYGTFYSILIPIILTSFSLYFPMVYSYRKGLFNSKVIRKIIIIDSIVLSCSIMLIPTIIGLELVRLGISVDVIIIILSTFVLLFGFLKFLDFNAKRIHLKDIYSINLKFIQIFVWFSITFLILLEFILIIFFVFFNIFTLFIISLSFLIFFFLNLYNIKQINNLKEFLSENKDLMLNYLKIYTVFEYYRNIIFFGIISSLSLFLTFLIPVYNLLILLPAELLLLGIFWFLGFFFSFILILLILSELIFKTKFSMYTAHFKLISWLYLKVCISLTLAIYTYPFSIFNKINLFILIFINSDKLLFFQ